MSVAIAAVAAWYSITGLTAIFAGAKIAIVVMGCVLEAGKLVAVSWLQRNWHAAPLAIKSYLTAAVAVLMVITSLGIFGFLSKAHIEHTTLVGTDNDITMEVVETRIAIHQRSIEDARTALSQLDDAVDVLISYDRIRGPDGALQVRASQQDERDALNETVNQALRELEVLQQEKAQIQRKKAEVEVEVGPIRYVAALIGDDETDLGRAVRVVTLLLVFVFDPLAVALLMAANAAWSNKAARASKNTLIIPKSQVAKYDND